MRLAQVFVNLLLDASRYTAEKGRIGLAAAVDGECVKVAVSDSGIGMAAEALSTVFEAFSQDPRAVAMNGTGLGIGLAIVREVVLAHGGSVTAHSAGTGRGSRFVVTLPLASGALDDARA